MAFSESSFDPKEDTITFYQDANIVATLSTRPSTPEDTLIRVKAGPLSQQSRSDFISVLQSTKVAASIVKKATQVQRVALATTSNDSIKLIPLHGLSANWKPILDDQKEYHATYPGHISSRSGPKFTDETLNDIQKQLTNGSAPAMNTTCTSPPGAAASTNLFARIIRAEISSQWRIWSSNEHLAFLTPYANSPGKTILVPRKHLDSDILALSDERDFKALMGAVWDVMLAITNSRFGAKRVGLIFEGCEVDWAHAKLIPIREGEGKVLRDGYGGEQGFAERYEGSVSSLPGPVVGLGELEGLLARFRAVAAGDLSGE